MTGIWNIFFIINDFFTLDKLFLDNAALQHVKEHNHIRVFGLHTNTLFTQRNLIMNQTSPSYPRKWTHSKIYFKKETLVKISSKTFQFKRISMTSLDDSFRHKISESVCTRIIPRIFPWVECNTNIRRKSVARKHFVHAMQVNKYACKIFIF